MDGTEPISESGAVAERSLAAQVNALHKRAELHRDLAIAHGGKACGDAIECGVLLAQAKEEHPGEFILWLESNCPTISPRTARNYMAVARNYRQALADGLLDFQALKELYIATGIMPEPILVEHDSTQPLPIWLRVTTRLDALIIKLAPSEKESLKAWCLATLKRL